MLVLKIELLMIIKVVTQAFFYEKRRNPKHQYSIAQKNITKVWKTETGPSQVRVIEHI